MTLRTPSDIQRILHAGRFPPDGKLGFLTRATGGTSWVEFAGHAVCRGFD
jgi:hypothetical protein